MYYAKIAQDTVQFMTESVQRGDAFGNLLTAARANTQLFKEEDEVKLEERHENDLFDASEVAITKEDTLEAAKRYLPVHQIEKRKTSHVVD